MYTSTGERPARSRAAWKAAPSGGVIFCTPRKPGRVEAAAVAEHLAHLLVLPRREVLEHVERLRDDLQAVDAAAQQPDRGGERRRADQARRLGDLGRRELEPELRGLVDRLEQQLVAVRPFLGRLLEREQLVGAEVALVVGAARALEHRLG